MSQVHRFEGELRWTGSALQTDANLETGRAPVLHAKAHANCFMSNSVNFEVKVEPAVTA